jgi:hypothetical protein
MSLQSYTKSITTDFGGIPPDYGQLVEEIEELNLTSVLNTIEPPTAADPDLIIFQFETALSSFSPNDLDPFNNYISGYIKDDLITDVSSFSCVSLIGNNEITSSDYMPMAEFTYPGSRIVGTITAIKVSSYMDSGCDDYTIEIIDPTHGEIIATETFTNNKKELLSMGSISNIPKKETELEIYVKRTSSNSDWKAYIRSITIYHE